ncbi:type II toxin-antitoxin system HipA family toxin [Nocardia sp. NPDC057353]|uniref:type II toxin-antitoxin system HipA family toxin n=1 Tax=Nocardia sp. NPDC057353 TaxID=3346104 RepID=UPI003638508A
MTESARHAVWLHDQRIGWLFHHDNFSWFEFGETYLDDPERPVLGLRFEENLRGRFAANLRLPQWFSNLLPEGPLRDWIASERGVASEREMELLAQVGHDLPGAVRVLPAELEEVPDVAEVLEFDADPGAERVEQPWKFSLAGVALKFSTLRDGGRFTCTATGQGGDWIVKLPDRYFPDVPRNEYTMMRFARAVGIDVPEVELVHRDDIFGLPSDVWPMDEDYAYAVQRFDRGTDRRLVHIEDLAQVRGFYPAQKYDGNFETIAALIYRGHDERALHEFVRRLVFFVLIGNGDAHLKNWSLIYRDRRTPTLSPVYDVMSTEVYELSDRPEDLGLKFAGDRRFSRLRIQQFQRLSQKLGYDGDLVSTAVDVVKSARSAWPEFASELESFDKLRRGVDDIVARRCAALLQGG